jgi:hypothetical protein
VIAGRGGDDDLGSLERFAHGRVEGAPHGRGIHTMLLARHHIAGDQHQPRMKALGQSTNGEVNLIPVLNGPVTLIEIADDRKAKGRRPFGGAPCSGSRQPRGSPLARGG